MKTQKITVTLPTQLLQAHDAEVPTRQRSTFIADAIHQMLQLKAQNEALDEAAGSWKDEDYPELADAAAIDGWLSQLRLDWQRTT